MKGGGLVLLKYDEKDLSLTKNINIKIEQKKIEGLLLKEFNFVEDFLDFSANLSVFIPPTRDYLIEPYMDVGVYFGDNLYNGGIINRVEYIAPYFNKLSRLVRIEVVGYRKILQGRTVKLTEDEVESYKNVGDIVRALVNKWLIMDGITIGRVDDGIPIEEIEDIKGYDAISIYDLMEYFSEISGYLWFVDKNRKLYFYSVSERIGTDWGDKEAKYQLTEDNEKFFNIDSIVSNFGGYANRVFVIGGENEDETIDEKNLTLDDYTFTVADNTAEMSRLKGITNKSGVVGTVINRPEVKTLKQLDAIARKELADRSSKPLEISISTSNHEYQVGDFIFVDLPKYKIKETLCITRIELTSVALKVPYKLSLQNKSQFLMNREDAYSFFGRLSRFMNKRKKNKDKIIDPLIKLTKRPDLWFVDYKKFVLSKEKDIYGNTFAKDNIGNKLRITGVNPEYSVAYIENDKLDKANIQRPEIERIIGESNFEDLNRTGALIRTTIKTLQTSYNHAYSGADIFKLRIENVVGFEWLLFNPLNAYIDYYKDKGSFYILVNGKQVQNINKDTFKAGANTLMVLYTENNIIKNFGEMIFNYKGDNNATISSEIKNNKYLNKALFGDDFEKANESVVAIEKHVKYIPTVPKSKEQALQELMPIYKNLLKEV